MIPRFAQDRFPAGPSDSRPLAVESRSDAVEFRQARDRPFRSLVPEYLALLSVSTPRSSNRTCGFPASGFSHVQQTLSGMPVVQAFAQEERVQERFLTFANARIRTEQRNTVVSSIYALGSGLIITLGNAGILWMGAHHVLAGRLSLGRPLVFLSYLTSLYGQMRVITEMYRTLQQTAASMDRVMEMLEPEQDVKERADAIRLPRIKRRVVLENVTFGYEPGRPSVRGVCLEARPGETLAVVGPTGAGKSTLSALCLDWWIRGRGALW